MKATRYSLLTAFALLTLVACARQEPPSSPAGDATAEESAATVVFVNGDIVSLDASVPSPEAVAVRDGRILATGTRDTVMGIAGDGAMVRDLEGHALLPGLSTPTATFPAAA